MSKKYYDRVLTGNGISNKKFHSHFGASVLKKFGWSEGESLGKDNTGLKECIQVKRRKEKLGLGAQIENKNQWNNWWDDLYNTTAKNLMTQNSQVDSSDVSSSEDDQIDIKKKKKIEINGIKRGHIQLGKLQRIKEAEKKFEKEEKYKMKNKKTNLSCLDCGNKHEKIINCKDNKIKKKKKKENGEEKKKSC